MRNNAHGQGIQRRIAVVHKALLDINDLACDPQNGAVSLFEATDEPLGIAQVLLQVFLRWWVLAPEILAVMVVKLDSPGVFLG